MKKKELNAAVLREETIKRIKSPQELLSNSMTTTKKPFSRAWRPNNYRRQIEIKERSNSAINLIKATIPSRYVTVASHSGLVFVKNYHGVTIQLGKNKLVAILSQNVISGAKETYIFNGRIKYIDEQIELKKAEFKQILDEAINHFIKRFDLALPLAKISWSRFEDWSNDDDYIIDKFRKDAVFYTEHFKKVYGEGVEFHGGKGKEPTQALIRHLKNSALNDLQPELVDELRQIRSVVGAKLNPLYWLKETIVVKEDIFDDKTKEVIRSLTVEQMEKFELMLFDKFGVSL